MPIDEIKLSGNHYEVGVQQGRIMLSFVWKIKYDENHEIFVICTGGGAY
jgi:hypothetical protein